MHAAFNEGPPGIGGVAQGLSHPVKGDVHIIVDKHRLDVGGDVQFPEALKLAGVCDLAVHDTVAGMEVGHGPAGVFDGVQAHLDGAVADGVDGRGHIVPVGLCHHGVELLLGEQGQPPGGGIIGIGLPHQGGAGAQGAVGQQFDAGDLEAAVAEAVVPAVPVKKDVHLLLAVHQGLFGHAQLQVSPVAGLPQPLHHLIGAAVREIFEVVRLDAGEARREQVLLRLQQLVQQLVRPGSGQVTFDVVQDDLLHHAVGAAVRPALCVFAVAVHGVPADAQQLHGPGVQRAHMEAGSHHQNGIFCGDGVQVPVGGEPPLSGKAVLVPALTDQPEAAVFVIAVFKKIPHAGNDLPDRTAATQVRAHFGLYIVHIMHMAVVETGQQQLPSAVHRFQVGLGVLPQELLRPFRAAHIGEKAADDHRRLRGGRIGVHGGDGSVFDPERHDDTSYFISLLETSILIKSVQGNQISQKTRFFPSLKIRACFFAVYPLY